MISGCAEFLLICHLWPSGGFGLLLEHDLLFREVPAIVENAFMLLNFFKLGLSAPMVCFLRNSAFN